MPHYNLAFLGFGNVGRALARLLLRKQSDLQALYNLTYAVTGIATSRHGTVIDHDGLDLNRALEIVEGGTGKPRNNGKNKEHLDSLSAQPAPEDRLAFIRSCGADVLFESIPVNYETGQPAVDYLRAALESSMIAVTANKGPVVHAYRALTDLAEARGVKFYFESAVMDGAPIFSLFRETLPAVRLMSFQGILNSTTNLILTRMEGGETFEDAVASAQSIGIAETDLSGDIDGWDAAVKVAALSTVLMDTPLKPAEVDRTGIRGITPKEIERARKEGKRWKLVCSCERQENGVVARVAPEMVDPGSALYNISGTTSIVQFETDVLSLLSVVETDPGPETTAYGMLADFLNAVRKI